MIHRPHGPLHESIHVGVRVGSGNEERFERIALGFDLFTDTDSKTDAFAKDGVIFGIGKESEVDRGCVVRIRGGQTNATNRFGFHEGGEQRDDTLSLQTFVGTVAGYRHYLNIGYVGRERSIKVGGRRVGDSAIVVVEKVGGNEDGCGHHRGGKHATAGEEILDELRDSLDRICFEVVNRIVQGGFVHNGNGEVVLLYCM